MFKNYLNFQAKYCDLLLFCVRQALRVRCEETACTGNVWALCACNVAIPLTGNVSNTGEFNEFEKCIVLYCSDHRAQK